MEGIQKGEEIVANQQQLVASVSNIIARIHDDARRGDFDLVIDEKPLKFHHASLSSPEPVFMCTPGSVLRGTECGMCIKSNNTTIYVLLLVFC